MGRKTETHRQWETIEMKRAKDITHATIVRCPQYIYLYRKTNALAGIYNSMEYFKN